MDTTHLLDEQELGQMIRQTLLVATRPSPGRLAQLRPAVPRSRFYGWGKTTLWARAATACLFLLLVIGGYSLERANQNSLWFTPSPSVVAATATTTTTPTVTATRLAAETEAAVRPAAFAPMSQAIQPPIPAGRPPERPEAWPTPTAPAFFSY
ncbi:MAG: hypothetical protein AB1791_13075 [Chloroflexota bacterium]